MGLPVEINPLFVSSTGGYQVGRSLRFRNSATAYLSRSPASAGNQQKMTFSFWVKRGQLGVSRGIYCSGASGSGATQGGAFIQFQTTDTLTVNQQTNNAYDWILTPTQVFRDPSAWYHIVVGIDTTQATASNRVLMYVNGVQVTSFSAATYPTLNLSTKFNASGATNFGATIDAGAVYFPFDGYLAEVNFIDGQALTPSSFGAYDTNGVWQPAKYTGTYGTNGFYLPFSNTSSTATLGNDFSGNSNTWTVNNISLTAGTTYDSMIDSPTVSASSSNYAVLNPLTNGSYTTLSGGNLNTSGNTVTNNGNSRSSFAFTTGKWYAEFTVTGVNSTYPQYGIMQSSDAQSPNNAAPQAGYGSILNSVAYRADGTKTIANTSSAYGSSYTTNDVIGIAIDADNGAVYFSKNGTFQNSGVPTSGSSKTGAALTWTGSSVELVIAIAEYNGSGSATNFGQRPFTYTPPTGYSALNTYNLPAATIKNGAQYMAATLYTGTGASNAISNAVNGVSFAPDFIWLKSRSGIADHALMNTVVGATLGLSSNNTSAEFNQSANFSSFNSNGFTVQGTSTSYNTNGSTFVGWQWKAGGTGVTNTSGSITSTVSANTTAGFSIVTYTGTGANATVGHGLGVAPSMIIVKNRSSGVTDWAVYHSNLTSAAYYLWLNSTQAQASSAIIWNNTAPTSSVFSIGTGSQVNGSSNSMVAYCFAAIRGFSAFGSYAGNSSVDGPFIFTGFRPRFILIKEISGTNAATNSWILYDTSRNTYNVSVATLRPNTTGAESTSSGAGGNELDILSNGFKPRTTWDGINESSGTYIYAAFAENPFNSSRAR